MKLFIMKKERLQSQSLSQKYLSYDIYPNFELSVLNRIQQVWI